MRASDIVCTIALGLTACSGREPLAPAANSRCGDGVPVDGEVCLQSFAVNIPYAYGFMGRIDANTRGDDNFFATNDAFSFTQLSSWALFFTPLAADAVPQPIASFEFADHQLYRPVLADLDGDGRTDLLSPSEHMYWAGGDTPSVDPKVEFWRNRGGYQFELQSASHSQHGIFPSIATGDIDGDGRPDALIADNTSALYVWAYAPDTDELTVAESLDVDLLGLVAHPQVAAADFNGDTHADFVLADGAGRVWWLLGGPDHQLTLLDPVPSSALGVQPITLLARDIDGDELVDLVAVRFNPAGVRDTDTISLARGLPDGRFEPLATFETEVRLTHTALDYFSDITTYIHIGLFDLDGSGELALVYAHHERPELVVHPRIARTLGDEPVIFSLDFQAHSFFVDDLDGDGEDSIYVAVGQHEKVEPNLQAPSGSIDTYSLVRFVPDP